MLFGIVVQHRNALKRVLRTCVFKVTQPSKSVQLRFHRSEVSKDDKVLRLSSDQQQGAKE